MSLLTPFTFFEGIFFLQFTRQPDNGRSVHFGVVCTFLDRTISFLVDFRNNVQIVLQVVLLLSSWRRHTEIEWNQTVSEQGNLTDAVLCSHPGRALLISVSWDRSCCKADASLFKRHNSIKMTPNKTDLFSPGGARIGLEQLQVFVHFLLKPSNWWTVN